ncbi:hypothetical protein HAX54_045396 [Datura stramonium]|uniref:Uncharacterized protein n=1 Tax=Datura stramonium TaxID=4076 RepID=A0ABS8WHQ8_DATST|nr:hypothetical protein [Datura stramonium]
MSRDLYSWYDLQLLDLSASLRILLPVLPKTRTILVRPVQSNHALRVSYGYSSESALGQFLKLCYGHQSGMSTGGMQANSCEPPMPAPVGPRFTALALAAQRRSADGHRQNAH